MSELTINFAIVPVYSTELNDYLAIRVPEVKDITEQFSKNVLAIEDFSDRAPYYKLRDKQWNPLYQVTRKNKPWYETLQVQPSESRIELLKIINPDILKKIQKQFPKCSINAELIRNVNSLANLTEELEIKREEQAKIKAEKAAEKEKARKEKEVAKAKALKENSKKAKAKKSTKKTEPKMKTGLVPKVEVAKKENKGSVKTRIQKATEEQARRIKKNLENTVYQEKRVEVPKATVKS